MTKTLFLQPLETVYKRFTVRSPQRVKRRLHEGVEVFRYMRERKVAT